jgi:small multidrug resistance pump
MATLFLLLAIVSEVIGTTALKFTNGFTNFWPSAIVVVGYGASYYFLALALKGYGIGALYAIWSGLGTTLIYLIGIWFLKEPFHPVQLVWVGLIIVGVIGLQLSTGGA